MSWILGVFCTDTACEDIFLPFMDDLVSHVLAEMTRPRRPLRRCSARVGLAAILRCGARSSLSEESQCGLFCGAADDAGPRHPRSEGLWPRRRHGEDRNAVRRTLYFPPVHWKSNAPGRRPGGKYRFQAGCHWMNGHSRTLSLPSSRWTLGGGNNKTLADIMAAYPPHSWQRPAGRFDIFNDSLITAGWIDAHAERYRENRFFVREIHYFEVRDGFHAFVPEISPRASRTSPTRSTRRCSHGSRWSGPRWRYG